MRVRGVVLAWLAIVGANLLAVNVSASRAIAQGNVTVVEDTVTASVTQTLMTGPSHRAPVLTGETVYLGADGSTSVSGQFSKFEWDLDGDGIYELDTGLEKRTTTKFSESGIKTVGVRVTSRGGLISTATTTIEVRKAPPKGEPGVSIKDGASSTNTKSVQLNLVWPDYASEVRISNDGGFALSKTKTVPLSEVIDWELDDSVKGLYTKVVYVRFSGSGLDTTKTYSDDIILDTTAPTIESSSAVATSTNIELSLNASDDITGVDKVEIASGSKTVQKDYSRKIEITREELGLGIVASGVRKSSTTEIRFRVRDAAENWTAWQTLTVLLADASSGQTRSGNPKLTTPSTESTLPGAKGNPTPTSESTLSGLLGNPTPTTSTAALRLSINKPLSAREVALLAKIKVQTSSKVSLVVSKASQKYCTINGTRLRGKRSGICRVTIRVKQRTGKLISKVIALRVST